MGTVADRLSITVADPRAWSTSGKRVAVLPDGAPVYPACRIYGRRIVSEPQGGVERDVEAGTSDVAGMGPAPNSAVRGPFPCAAGIGKSSVPAGATQPDVIPGVGACP